MYGWWWTDHARMGHFKFHTRWNFLMSGQGQILIWEGNSVWCVHGHWSISSLTGASRISIMLVGVSRFQSSYIVRKSQLAWRFYWAGCRNKAGAYLKWINEFGNEKGEGFRKAGWLKMGIGKVSDTWRHSVSQSVTIWTRGWTRGAAGVYKLKDGVGYKIKTGTNIAQSCEFSMTSPRTILLVKVRRWRPSSSTGN